MDLFRVGAIPVPHAGVATVVGGGTIGLVVFLFAYSYWVWRHLPRAGAPNGPTSR